MTENIADLGGVSCVLEIAEQNGYDLKKVMEAWASLWAEKSRPETLSNQIAVDVHSPGKIRVNAVLSSMDQFYEVYGIEEGDGMYYPSGRKTGNLVKPMVYKNIQETNPRPKGRGA